MSAASIGTTRAASWPDAAFIERAVDRSNLNALRMALYQQTGDPELAAMRPEPRSVRGGAMTVQAVARADRAALKRKAMAYLCAGPSVSVRVPDRDEAQQLLGIFGMPAESAPAARMAFEELAFDPESRDPAWKHRPTAAVLANYTVTIIGAGVSGLATAIKLKKLGIPFEIIERQAGIGGTWLLNDYPEARVDISNFVYEYKFEKNYPWRGYFASQPEIRQYLEHIATKYDLLSSIRFNTEVIAASWDEADRQWRLELRVVGGETEPLSTRILISAAGLFSTPNLPDIAGIGSFAGKMFHTTAWDHDFEIAGKRVALIGTGSSGAQLMPHLANQAASLTVFQRTPNWIVPIEGYHAPITPEQAWLMKHLPYYWNWFCYAMTMLDRHVEKMQAFDRQWQAAGGAVNERNDKFREFLLGNLTARLGQRPDLLEKCRPSYPPAARRLVVDNGWFDALLRPNVELVTEPILQVGADAITTRDGESRAFDLIVLGSGFQTSRYLSPVRYRGRGGITPEKLWAKDGARAYLGMTMPGFPNFFMFYGPNGQARSGSFHGWAEIWARYAILVVVGMIERGAEAAEVRQDVFQDYNTRLDAAMTPLIWGGGGAGSYYLNEQGRRGVNMPWTAAEYYSWVMEPCLEDFDLA